MELLWSINERLGGNAGLDIPRPTVDWMDDMLSMAQDEASDIEAYEQMKDS